jgi:oligopeptide/dipeptide ABC transporter ATP-binding protein
MNSMDNILEVKKLKISFRTINGTVKAVRDISFDLKRGETLAIVGESGSGKSVTSKAILGILAGNSIIDGGEILFDGKDLLRISEEEMYKIRGDKISMIFQDPLSSLNPIVKIGRQMTEGMILKNKDNRKNARNSFNERLEVLKNNMIEAIGVESTDKITEMCKVFDDFNIEAIKLEESFNDSEALAQEVIGLIKDFLFKVSRKVKLDIKQEFKQIIAKSSKITDKFLTRNHEKEALDFVNKLAQVSKESPSGERTIEQPIVELLNSYIAFLERLLGHNKPDFFRIGYYHYKKPEEEIYNRPMGEFNEICLEFLNKDFMNEFIELAEKGLINCSNKVVQAKKDVLNNMNDLVSFFKQPFEKKEAIEKVKEFDVLLNESINKLDIIKDSVAYTFTGTVLSNINDYFVNIISNEKDQNRFEKQTAKYEKLIQRGKQPEWKVIPLKYVDPQNQIDNILNAAGRIKAKYEQDIKDSSNIDFNAETIKQIDHFKELASNAVYKVTQGIAKEKAIKLMEEVGIPEPRIRYNQYPFEFSGGMRQRIVIAIALSANPDILICDEPTTALDVTIQSQILELINNLKVQRNLSVIFITHDLGVVANMADRVAVMYAGKIVEYGTSNEIFYSPAHPYTWALLSSMPDLDTKEKLEAIPGTPPNMIYPPKGDAFAVRNKYALKIDFEEEPPLFKISDTHYAATWLLHKDAPKVEMPKSIRDRIERMKKHQGGNLNG